MMSFIIKYFDAGEKRLKSLYPILDQVNAFESEVKKYSDKKIKERTADFKSELAKLKYEEHTDYLDKILPEAFAIVREAAFRVAGVRHYDVQILAGIALHKGKISEQKTGEGKTLTATAPLYLNSLTGRGCHLVTPNDYLSRHGAGWYGPLYTFLGVSVGVLAQNESFVYDPSYTNASFEDSYSKNFKPDERKNVYACDITYGTNNEFGFDYLRDNMQNDYEGMVQVNANGNIGAHYFAIVDEIDSILVDEARTPLIISSPSGEDLSDYKLYAKIADSLVKGTDYKVEEKEKSATLSEIGLVKVEKSLGVANLYEENFEAVKQVENALKAKALYIRDKDYVVQNGAVKIVDEFTGRILESNRYSGGLHQAVEAKENVEIQQESKTVATTSYQNYFRLYKKLAGMTGTAKTEEEEFYKIYGLEVIAIPTDSPVIRKDNTDVVYKTESAKFRAVAEDIKVHYGKGQPVLVGTTSVDRSELLSSFLKRLKIPHTILNAKQHEKEAMIIAQAGRVGGVTVATNMAGRGVDIILGGDPVDKKEQQRVKDLGGLYVIGTERHESRRIDNQLRGRSGRQGDPGESSFYISLQDDLMRIFGGAQVESLMNKFGVEEDTPLSAGMVSRAIENAQKKVEGMNFDHRKNLVEYDDVMNVQREIVYKLRRRIMQAPKFEEVHGFIEDGQVKMTREQFATWYKEKLSDKAKKKYEEFAEKYKDAWFHFLKVDTLNIINSLWMDHIDIMADLRQGVGLRGHGQMDPLVEYKREGKLLFEKLINTIWGTMNKRIETVDIREAEAVKERKVVEDLNYNDTTSQEYGVANEAEELGTPQYAQKTAPVQTYINTKKVGRNDLCPCGSGKKYKHCHGKNS